MATREEVEALLVTVRELVGQGRVTFVPRQKNIEGMAQLGITNREAEASLAALTVNNYSRGPEEDQDGSGEEVWIFGRSIDRVSVYIKFKVQEERSGPFVKCLSFHPSDPNERELQFPLRPTR